MNEQSPEGRAVPLEPPVGPAQYEPIETFERAARKVRVASERLIEAIEKLDEIARLRARESSAVELLRLWTEVFGPASWGNDGDDDLSGYGPGEIHLVVSTREFLKPNAEAHRQTGTEKTHE